MPRRPEVAENLLVLQADFLVRALGVPQGQDSEMARQ